MTSTKYGCHSKPREDAYWARRITPQPYGYPPYDGWIFIEDTMSKECRYDQQATDAKCIGCTKAKA